MDTIVQSLSLFDVINFVLVFVCGFIGSSVNAFAGGGTFLAFPALLYVGLPPIIANATCKLAFIPGNLSSCWAYRRSFSGVKNLILSMMTVGLVGGTAGALLTIYLGNDQFKKFIPWLILGATLLSWYGPLISKRLQKDAKSYMGKSLRVASKGVLLFTSIYGGFFGAGIGVLLIAALGLRGISDINVVNAIKNVMSVLINVAAIIMYIMWGTIDWTFAGIQMAGAILGGYAGGVLGRTMNPIAMRRLIFSIGIILSIIYFYKYN